MSECPSLAGCPFYNETMAEMPSMTKIYKKNYCKSNYDTCARWKIASTIGKEAVPLDLFPNNIDRANEIVKQKV